MPNPPIDWSSAVAERVCTLVRDDRVLARFRAQCAAFLDEKRRDEEQLAAWKRRRKAHCERELHTLAEFKARTEETERLGDDREAIERTRPPEDTEKNWGFDYYQEVLGPDELARLGSPANGSMLIAFCVWVPPELCASAAPKLTVPSLFGRFTGHLHSPPFGRSIEPGKASWAEKYASLATIHDARFPDRDPIDELHHINYGRLTEEVRRRERNALRRIVSELPNAAKANVQAWLADVEGDLDVYVKLDQPPATPGAARPDWKPPTRRIDERASDDPPDSGKQPGASVDPFRIAALAQRTAETIRKLPYLMYEIVESSPWPPFAEVRELLNPTRIDVDFMDVALYVERHWTPSHAQKLVGQLHKVTNTVSDFLHVYEWVTDKYQNQREKLSWRREDGATFLVVWLMVAKEVAQWAEDIEDRAKRDGCLSRAVTTNAAIPSVKEPIPPWTPPPGYVGRKTICNGKRFRKGEKNPSPTTIDVWVKAAQRDGNPVKIEKARDTGENHYPEAWIVEQIRTWNPRANKRNPST